MSTGKAWREGWPVTAWAALIVAVVVFVTLAAAGSAEPGLRATIRTTARLSALLLLPSFLASSANARWRTPFTKWLLRNRRYLGLGFAVSQFTHGAFVLTLAQLHAGSFWTNVDPTTVVGGGIGYVFLVLMTVTSFDRTAAWLGRRRWRALHTTGVFLFFGIFVFSFAQGIGRSPVYAALVVLLLAALALRLAVRLARVPAVAA